MKLFIFGVVTTLLMGAVIYQLLELWRKRLTFTTAFGQRVYDLGLAKVLGWTLTKQEIERLEVAFLLTAPKYGFAVEEIKKFFRNNTIYYKAFPIVDIRGAGVRKDTDGSGYVSAYYKNNNLYLGIQPFVERTALAHELVHDLLKEKTGSEDPQHANKTMWESGLVGEINNLLKEKRNGNSTNNS